ncbi:MAG: hypothetical protein KF878_26735 [Planctomycetes bacterium]|nr:hypothetical protein [Planctomycetota bacterium]
MTLRRLVPLLLLPLGCAAPPPRSPPPPPPPPRETPAIVMRGSSSDARPRREPSPPPSLVLEAGPALEVTAGPPPAEPPRTLPVVLGDTQGLGLRVQVTASDDGWAARVEVHERARHAWAAVEVALEPLAGRRALDEHAVLVRLGPFGAGGRVAETVAIPLPPDADRVRASVTAAEPRPGEVDVACQGERLRGFEVLRARLLRTRTHELDAILDLDGGPLEHVPWSVADLEVTFLDDRGGTITTGRARLARGRGPPWRLHVVGAEASRRQVGSIVARCANLRFD